MAKRNPCQGKHREFANFAKTQGIWSAQVVNSLILKVKEISKFATKISKSFLKLDKSAKLVLCIHVIVTNHINWHMANLPLDKEKQGTHREFKRFEWVPCNRKKGV